MFKNVKILFLFSYNIEKELLIIDLIIGVVFIFGVKVFYFIICFMLKLMKKGIVLVDVVID